MSEYNFVVINWACRAKTDRSRFLSCWLGHAMDIPMDQCSCGIVL